MTQTTVSEFRDQYVAGQLHNPSIADTESRIVDDSTNIVPGDDGLHEGVTYTCIQGQIINAQAVRVVGPIK